MSRGSAHAAGRRPSDRVTAQNAAAEQEALVLLNQRFRAALLRYFDRRFSDTSEREDLVQEVFARLIYRSGIASLENPEPYVFKTASNVLKDRLRGMRVRHVAAHDQFEPDLHQGEDFSPEDVLLSRERLARATAALQELPERTRVIFVLRRLEGLRFQDIAARFGITVSAVEKHMQRAMAHMVRKSGEE